MELARGTQRGVHCVHMQALLTNILQRHWKWQEDRWTDLQPGFYRYNTAFLASLDVKTVFDVAKPSVVSRILSLTGVHGHVVAALLAEMQDVQGLACFESCRGASARGAWRLQCRGGRVAKYVVWKAEKKVEGQRREDLPSDGRTTTSACFGAWCGLTIIGFSVIQGKIGMRGE